MAQYTTKMNNQSIELSITFITFALYLHQYVSYVINESFQMYPSEKPPFL